MIMADSKISDLSANGTLDGTELFELVQSGSNVKALLSAIKTYIVNEYLTPTINTQPGTSYTLLTVDNDGKSYVRMTNASANTVTVTTSLTKPVSISQRGAGTTTLVEGAGVTLNGTLAFSAQHQTKTVIPIGGGVFDVVG
jgi:hypothetical protein